MSRQSGRFPGRFWGMMWCAVVVAVLVAVAPSGAAQEQTRAQTQAEVQQTRAQLVADGRAGRLVFGKGWLEIVDGLKVVHFKGTPEEIGAQNAALLVKPQEEEMLAVFRRLDPSRSARGFREKAAWALKNFYAWAKFVPAFKRHIPREYQDELRGFVRTASDAKDSNIDSLIMANAFQDLGAAFGCSSFAAFGPATVDGKMYIGRNLDNPSLLDIAGYQVVAFYEPEKGFPFVTLTAPSFVGIMHGMNSQGLVVAMDYSVAAGEELSIDGVPFTIMLRQVLQYAGSVDEAVEMIRSTPRTIGLNILVSDSKANHAVVVEAAANRFVVREAKDGVIFATNRYETPFMKEVQGGGWLASALRDKRFEEIFAEQYGKIDLPAAVRIVRDKFAEGTSAHDGFVSGIDNEGTMASLIFEPARRRVWVARPGGGRPAPDNDFIAFDLDREFSRGAATEEPAIRGEGKGNVAGKSGNLAADHFHLPATEETAYFRDWRAVRQAKAADLMNRSGEVAGLLAPVVERNPEVEEALLALGRAYLKTGRFQDALPLLERVTALPAVAEPRNLLEAHYWLGLAADLRGLRADALSHYFAAQEVSRQMAAGDFGREGDVFSRMTASGLLGPLRVNRSGRVVATVPAKSGGSTDLPPGKSGGVEQWLEGKLIARITVLGAAQTRESLILAQLPFRVGDAYSSKGAALGRARLEELDIFDDRMYKVNIVAMPSGNLHGGENPVQTPGGVEVVVRVVEAGLLYKDPIEFAAVTGQNLVEGRVEQTFRNIGGTGVNISGGYGWGNDGWWSWGASSPFGLEAGERRWAGAWRANGFDGTVSRRLSGGKYDGQTIQGHATRAATGLAWHPATGWRLSAGLGYYEAAFIDGTSPILPEEKQQYLTGSGSARWNAEGKDTIHSLSLELKARGMHALDGLNPGFGALETEAGAEVNVPGGLILLPRLGAGMMPDFAPANLWYGVGGFSPVPLRGHATLYGTRYLSGTLELRRPLDGGVTVAVFADAAGVWQRDQLLMPHIPVDVGGGVIYQAPVGPPVRLDVAVDPQKGAIGWKLSIGGTF